MPSNLSARENSGGSFEMSLLVQTTNTSLIRSFIQVRSVPNSRAVTPLSAWPPAAAPASAFSTSSIMRIAGDMASARRSAWRMFASLWPTRDPINAPTSRISVGRPVSLPRARATQDFPEPGGPSRRMPRALASGRTPGRRARAQNVLSALSPPSSANDSPPRCRVRSPDFLSMPDLISQRTSGASRPWRTSERLKAFSASIRVSPAAASSTATRPSPTGSSPGSVAIERAMAPSWSGPGRSCSITTKSFSSSTGICTNGARMMTKVRAVLPATTWVSSAWTTSTEFRNLWKFRSTSRAVPSGVARAPRQRIAASGSAAPGTGSVPSARPARDSPRSTSQVASDQPWSRQRRAISPIASSCSCDWTQIPEKAARTYSPKPLGERHEDLLGLGRGEGGGRRDG